MPKPSDNPESKRAFAAWERTLLEENVRRAVGVVRRLEDEAALREKVGSLWAAQADIGKAGTPAGAAEGNTMPEWWKPNLPSKIQLYFTALERMPLGATREELMDEMNDYDPVRIWNDYPKWKSHIERFSQRAARGLYKLRQQATAERASKNPVTRQ